MNLWGLRGAHFAEGFETCAMEVVIPLGTHDAISLDKHEALSRELGVEGIFYALVDADGSVVLYELRPPRLWAPTDLRPLCDPAFLEPAVLAAASGDAQPEEDQSGWSTRGRRGAGKEAKGRAATTAKKRRQSRSPRRDSGAPSQAAGSEGRASEPSGHRSGT
ncbi:unnamed protein product [Polarella glacialis]|nr:unnamed protein product [Polarella glacialis]